MFEIKKKWKSPPPPPPPYEGETVTMFFELIGNNRKKDVIMDSVPEVGKLNFIKGVCEAKVPVEMADDFPSRCALGGWFKVKGKGEVTPAKSAPAPTPEPEPEWLRFRELNEKFGIEKADLKALAAAGKVSFETRMRGHVEQTYYSVADVKAVMEAKNEG